MFQNMKRMRPKSSPRLPHHVRPLLEFLEGRASPSALPLNRFPGDPLVEPLAPASAYVAQSEPEVLMTRPATLDQEATPAGAQGEDRFLVEGLSPGPATVAAGHQENPPGRGDPGDGQPRKEIVGGRHKLPVITLHASEGADGWWTFGGTVDADIPWGLIVHFDGLPSLKDQTAEVESNGGFQLPIKLPNCEEGLATAQTTDWEGQHSNVAEDYVHQTTCVAKFGK